MTITFEEYCWDYLDLLPELMTAEQLKNAKAGYAKLIGTQKTPTESAKHEKALAKAKEARKLAKFFGGKALTGSANQKKWAEEIRQKVLESNSLTEEQKKELVTLGGFTAAAKFWINNKDKSADKFNPEIIISANKELHDLYAKHYETLVRTNYVTVIEKAKKEIYDALNSLPINIHFEFPKCEHFYDNWGVLVKGLKFRC